MASTPYFLHAWRSCPTKRATTADRWLCGLSSLGISQITIIVRLPAFLLKALIYNLMKKKKMKTSMTVDEQINILKAFKAGKTIQAYHNGNWLDLNEDALSRPVTLRIKPDAKEIVTGTTGREMKQQLQKHLFFIRRVM